MLWASFQVRGPRRRGWPSPSLPSSPDCHPPPRFWAQGQGASGYCQKHLRALRPRASGMGFTDRLKEGIKMLLRIRERAFSCRSIQSPCGRGERGEQKRAVCTEISGTAGGQWASPGKLALWSPEHHSRWTLHWRSLSWILFCRAGWDEEGLCPLTRQAAWPTGKNSGLGARNPGS